MALKRDEIADPNSILNRAADDEPLFILRAKDPLAPKRIRDWAATAIMKGLHGDRVEEAWAAADRMDAWRRAHFPEIERVE